MELRPGEVMIDGEIYYSAAYLDSYKYAGRAIITGPDIVLPDRDVYFKTYPVASTSVRHARLIEAWAMCYCMVLALPHVPRACGRSIRRVFRHWMFWWVMGAIVAAVAVGVTIGFLLPA